MSERRRVAVVVNGRAGALLDAEGDGELEAALEAAGLEAEFVPADAGSLPERIEQAARSGAEIVVVAGGDGTVACAAAVLAGTEVTLGILPFGTMNLLAKDLGIPIGDLPAAVRLLAEGEARAIDVGAVEGHVFLCASMLGLPARLGRYREVVRERGSGWLRFGLAALRSTRRYVSPRLTLQSGGRTVTIRTPSLTIAVNRLDDRSGRMFGRSELAGGELSAYAVDAPRWQRLPSLLGGLLRGQWRNPEIVKEQVSARFVVNAHRTGLHVMNDGERMILQPPLHYEVRPGALRVIGR